MTLRRLVCRNVAFSGYYDALSGTRISRNQNTGARRGFPRRDLILLPLTSLLTILLMTGTAEIVARRIWPEKVKDDCQYYSKSLGERRRANCITLMKNVEGPWIRYQTNDCGFRNMTSCGPKPAGTLRVAIVGTSVAFGLNVPYDSYFANLAAPELSKIWGHPIEFQNMGDFELEWSKSGPTLNEIAELKPDAVIYLVLPSDLTRMDSIHAETPKTFVTSEPEKKYTWTDLRVAARESRILIMAQHFLLRDEQFFLSAFKNYADPNDVARQPTPALVKTRFERMGLIAGKLEDRMRRENIPCFMIALPNRIECLLISKNISLPHMNAYVFPERMREIARKNGMVYIDMVPEIRKTPNAERMFYAVDGHPNEEAHVVMARAVVEFFRPASPGTTSLSPDLTARLAHERHRSGSRLEN